MPFVPIKRGKEKGKYRSPSGRVFNKAQVRRYYARGGTFDSGFFCDAVVRSSDPTGTMDIRRKFGGMFDQRYRAVRAVLQKTVVADDILGLNPGSTSPIAMAGSTGNREIGFQTWFDALLKRVVVQDGEWMRPLIALAYNRAVARAQRLTKSQELPHDMAETIDALTALCYTEVQGIAEAVSQRVMRTALQAWLHNDKPAETFATMAQALSTIGITRGRAMAELMVVKAFTTGTLDQFEAAKVQRVGIVAELKQKAGMDHAAFGRMQSVYGDAGKGSGGGKGQGGYSKNFGLQGPGSRISRKGEGPSRSTISRIRAAQRALEEAGNVNVQTAGDENVCQQCQDIEDDNPHTIDEARSLIPAHPFCRCAFVPVDDNGFDWGNDHEMFARDEFNEELHPRDPDGRFANGESFKERDSLQHQYGSGEKTHNELVAAQPAYSADEKKAISVYSDHNFKGTPDYVKINAGLRNGTTLPDKLQNTVNALDKAMDKTSTPHDIVVFRAVRDVKGDIPEPKVGDHYQEKAYTSTSTEWHNAADFQQLGAKQHFLLRISVPKGSRAIAFGKALSKNPSEREVLLHRDARFHVTKVETITLKGRGERKLYHVNMVA